MPITINGNGLITGASTLATPVGSPTFTTPNIDSAQFPAVSGTAPLYAARAWVNFNGTGTVAIRASGNVSSITDNGVGDYTVNFTTAMPDANYSAVASLMSGVGTGNTNTQVFGTVATGSVRTWQVNSASGVLLDAAAIGVAIFR